MNLYELDANYKQLLERLDTADDETDTTALFDTLDSIHDDITTRFENIEKWRRNMQGDIEALKAEETRLKNKRQALENKCESLKRYLSDFMRNTGKSKFKAGIFNFTLAKNPPRVTVTDINAVPQEFLIPQEPKVDKHAISGLFKEATAEGIDIAVPGVECVQTEGLRVK